MMLLQPQEVEVYYILPAIRKALARELKALGKSQKEIARLLGVTEGAVSQYFHHKRGHELEFPKEFLALVHDAAPKVTDHHTMIKETQAILTAAKEQRLICKLHEKLGTIPKGCDACFHS